MIDAYAETVAGVDLEVVTMACKRFGDGEVPDQDKHYAPSAPELADQCRLFRDALAYRDRQKTEREKIIVYPIGELPPPPAVPLGPLEVDFGGGRIDMRDMTPAEKEVVLQNNGRVGYELQGASYDPDAPPHERVGRDSVPLKIKRMSE